MSVPKLVYQVIPGAREHDWYWYIFAFVSQDELDPTQIRIASNAVWRETGVVSHGSASSRARAEVKAERRIAKATRAYEMLAR